MPPRYARRAHGWRGDMNDDTRVKAMLLVTFIIAGLLALSQLTGPSRQGDGPDYGYER